MTIDEVSERYRIPLQVLREYERWGLCSAAKTVIEAWRYDDSDIERLGIIMTLHDVGFDNDEVEKYMRLLVSPQDTAQARLHMLNVLRDKLMKKIHAKQQCLDRLDYLRYEILQKT